MAFIKVFHSLMVASDTTNSCKLMTIGGSENVMYKLASASSLLPSYSLLVMII